MRRRARRRAGAFARAGEGVALIEFALVFPLLIILLLGLIEISHALAIQRRVSNAALTVADLVAQMQRVSEADLSNIALVGDILLQPYGAAGLALVVTSVEADADNRNTHVGWSFAHGAGATRHIKGASHALPGGLTRAGSSVILTEASYAFTPAMSYFLTGPVRLTGRGYFAPRASRVVVKVD